MDRGRGVAEASIARGPVPLPGLPQKSSLPLESGSRASADPSKRGAREVLGIDSVCLLRLNMHCPLLA